MKLPNQTIAQTLFMKFCEAYQRRDLSAILMLFTKNTNMWGSGEDEYRVGLQQVEEQLRRDWSQSQQGELIVNSFIPTAHDALWAAAICTARITIDGKQHAFDHLRGTIIIAKENGTWKIDHMHASFPDYRNAENGSFPIACNDER